MALQTNQFVDVPVFNALIPQEGPKCFPLTFDFTVQQSYTVDLTNQQQRGFLSAAQSVYVDNSVNAGALTIIMNQTGQLLTCPAYSQGFFSVLAANPIRFAISCPSGVLTTIWLLNVPTPSVVWSVSSAGQNTYQAGRLLVSDVSLDAAIISGFLQSQSFLTGTAGAAYPDWMGNLALAGSIAATSGALVTGNPGYYLTGASFGLSPGATQAATGDWTATVTDSSSGAVYVFGAFIPGAAPTLTAANRLNDQTAAGFRWNNKVANSTLSIVLSAPLTAGRLYYNVSYGQTGIVG